MLHLLYGRQVAPRTKRIDISTHRVDDVVDTVLDDDIGGTCHIHLDGETRSALQTVSLIGDAVILTENTRTTDSTTDDGSIRTESHLGHIVGPRLGSYGVAIANDGMILRGRQYVDGVEEIEPIGVA